MTILKSKRRGYYFEDCGVWTSEMLRAENTWWACASWPLKLNAPEKTDLVAFIRQL